VSNLKKFLTTGQVSRFFGVAPKTVSDWCDSGLIRGVFRIPPGSGKPGVIGRDRRIPAESMVTFCREHGIDVPPEIAGAAPGSILLAGAPAALNEAVCVALPEFPIVLAADAFECGEQVAVHRFVLAVVDTDNLPLPVCVKVMDAAARQGARKLIILPEDMNGSAPDEGDESIQRVVRTSATPPEVLAGLIRDVALFRPPRPSPRGFGAARNSHATKTELPAGA
jgi:hypothetical protein